MKKAKLILLVLIASLSFGFTTNVRAEEILEGEETKFNVVFKSDEKELKTISITENDSVTKIADPVQAGYTFLGWMLNDTFYDFTLPVTSDIELVASWQVNPETMPNRYTVSFSADDDIISIVEVEEKESVEAIDNPTKAGYNFVSWQLDGSDYDFTSAVTSDITLVATWEMNGKYVVTFVSDGVTLSEVEVESGRKVSAITETTKDGYTFKGWLLEEETYDFDTLVTSNITLNASWEANPGEIYIDKNAEVDEDGAGRDVEVNLEVEGNPYTEATSTDIIIVLDNSSSMRNHIDEDDASTEIRMTATKAAAIALVNKLFPDGVVTTNVRVGIVRYGTNTSSFTQLALTNNKATIINFINDIAVPTGQGTNVDAGLTKATEEINEITTSSNKYVILLSDGIPTYFTDSEGTVRGRGNADSGLCRIYNIWGGGWKWYESWSQGSQNYDTKTKCEAAGGTWHTPSSEALEVATGLKDLATIFTISFATERTQFMEYVATPAEGDDVYANSFEASSAEELNQKFDEIFNRISIVATKVVVTDIIPDTFDLDETDFIGRHGAATVIDGTTTKYGEDFIVEKLEDGTTKITWDLGSYDINRDYVLTYMVRAKAPYYGSMYTNVEATLTGTATDANPFYSDSKEINLVFNMPYVPVTSVTNNDGYGADTSQDDAYTVDRGETLVIDADNGILNNDYINEENAQQSDPENVVTVEDEIIVVNNSLTHGTILINEDGSFTYIADDSHYGTASFEYFIRTKVTENGKTIYLDSNISTVTFNILGYGTLTVKHVYEGTNGTYENIVTPLNSEKLIGTTYTTSALTDSKWHLVTTPSNAEGTYTNGTLEVTYVYEKVMGTVIAHYVDTEGNTISVDVTTSGQVNVDTYTTSQKTIANWTYKEIKSGSAAVSGTYTNGTLEVTYVYEKTMGTLDVKHVWMDGSTEVVILAEVQKSEQQGTAYTTNPLNSTTYNMWRLVTTPSNASGSYTDGNTTVTYVYEKVMGNVTVYYVEKDNHSNILDSATLASGQLGTSYTTSSKSIANWTFTGVTPVNASGTYIDGTITVYYEYTKTMGTLIVHYVEVGTNAVINPNDYTMGQVNVDTYTTSPKPISNWTYVGVHSGSAPVNGTYAEGDTNVIYTYTKTLGTVIAHYVDTEGNTISVDVTTSGQVNVDTYTTSQKTIANWTYKEIKSGSAAVSGTYTNGTLEVTYVYEKTMGTLDVKHVWMDGSTEVVILAEVQKSEQQGTAYTTNPLNSTTYNMWRLVTTPSNASGSYTDGNTTVTYVYEKVMGNVTVYYVEKDNHSNILDSATLASGQLGTSYTTSSKSIANWTFTGVTPSNASGNYTDGMITIYYEYTKTMGTVISHYVDTEGNTISADVTISGQVNVDTYTTSQKTIANWTYKEIKSGSAAVSGTYTNGTLDVTYVYEKTMGTVIAHYVDTEGNTISVDVTTSGQVNVDTYTTSQKTIANWTYKEIKSGSAAVSGTYTNGTLEVTYVYEKTMGTLDVKHVWMDGSTEVVILAEVQKSEQQGTAYTTNPLNSTTYNMWRLVTTPSNASGSYTDGNTTVTYVYEKVMGNVTVYYVEKDNHSNILDSATLASGQLGTSYTTSSKSIANWTFTGVTPSNASGNYTDGMITIYYEYTKTMGTVISHYVDTEGNTISADVTISGQVNVDTYTTSQKTIANWTYKEIKSGSAAVSGTYTNGTLDVTYVYEKTMGTVIAHYVDTEGNTISVDVTTSGQVNVDTYTTSQKTIANWTYKEIKSGSAAVSGTYTNGTLEVTYVYEKTMGTLDVKHVWMDGSTEVVILAEVQKSEQQGTAYTTNPLNSTTYNMWRLVTTPSNASGSYTDGNTTVTYVYEKVMGNVTVYYVEKDNHSNILDSATLASGQLGTSYTTSSKSIANWTFTGVTPSNASGNYTDGMITIYYEYTKTMGTVISHYVDTEGNTISADVTISGQVNVDTYTTSQKTIANWTYKEIKSGSAAVSGTYTNGTLDVTYVYEKTMGTVIAHYVDTEGNTISVDVTTSGQVNVDTYTTSQKTIANWTYKEIKSGSAAVSGTYTNGTLEVTYVYEKTMGTLDVKHVWMDGSTEVVILAEVQKSEQQGTAYTTNPLNSTTYNMWRLVTTPSNASGSYTDGNTTVTYVYEKVMGNVTVYYVEKDNHSNILDSATLASGQLGTSYTTSSKSIANWTFTGVTPSNASGNYTDGMITIYYEYTKTMGTVISHYVDTEGNTISADVTISGQVNVDTYTTSQKTIANWTYKEIKSGSAAVSGTYTNGTLDVTYVYEKTMGTVIAHYVDTEGNTISVDVTTSGQVNVDTYTTSQKTIANWTYKEIKSGSAAVSGTYTNGTLEVTYVYEKTMGTLDVKHVWMDGSTEVVILAEVQKSEQQGTAYTTNPLNSTTYNMWRLVTTPSNASGSYTDGNTTVTYVYEKVMGNVTVYYVEKDNHSNILDSATLASGQLGTSYTTSSKSIANWTFTGVTPSNASGNYTDGMITIYYEYTKTMGTVISHYVDTEGNTISADVTISGQVNVDTYTTSQKTIANWTYKEIKSGSAAVSGTYTNGTLDVTYVYEKTMGTVIAHYVDTEGNTISVDVTTSGQVNVDTYTTSQKTIANWTYKEIKSGSAAVSGTYTNGTLEVTYVYEKTMGTLDVKHVWMDGSTEVVILAEVQKSEQQGTAYTTNPLNSTTYNMWRLVTTPSNASGSYTDGNTTVTYVYEKVMGNVTVYYVEKDNHSNILDSATLASGQLGTSYTTSSKSIANWTFTGVTPSNASGNYTDGMITIYYEYTKTMGTVISHYVDTEGNTISADVTISGQVNVDTYTTSQKTIANWTYKEIKSGSAAVSGTYTNGTLDVTYVYEKTMGTVIAHYVDTEGNTISVDVTTSGQVNVDTYTTSQKTIANWTYKEIKSGSAAVSGTYTNGTLEVTYVYEKTMGTLDVKHVWMDGSTEVVILAEVQKSEQQGTAYTTNPLNSTTYNMWRLVTTPSNASGSYTDGNTTVTYVYEKVMGNVTVYYVEKDNHSNILDSATLASGQLGTSYTTSSKSIANWTFTGVTPSNASGNYTDGMITIYYEYTKTMGTVISHYVDTEGNTISADVTISGQVNVDTYTTSQKTIANWTYKEIKSGSAAVSGTYTNGTLDVTYVYEKTMGTVIAHYVDTKGNTLADDVTTTGQINVDTYATTQKTIANWTFANMLSESAATSGTYTNGTLEVTYIYDKTLGTVVVEHVYYNLLGEKIVILTEDTITAQTGTSYSTSPLDTTLEAYARFKLDDTKLPVNATGSIVEGETIVTYVYLKYSTVTIQYLDDKYDPLREEIVYYESIGTAYTSEEFVFEGYDILISPENPTGIHEEEDIVVTYVYGAIGGPEVPTGAFTNYLVEIIFMISLLAMAGLIIFKKKIMM